ncbi:pole-2 [Pristionchus pacificus]|uniref:DNA polymerase epsilon subunit n=1 Tax=Pristionchus pacificus TaxID=54126 RepID=A0A8R1Z5M9_PRIPA|nr:pole-2 [Pristionchus pacificus]
MKMADRDSLKKNISSRFKINAFTLKKDALEFAVEKLEPFDKDKRAYWIKRLIEGLRKENFNGTVVDLDTLRNVTAAVSTSRNDNIPILNVFDVTSVPRWDIAPDGELIMHEERKENGLEVDNATMALRQRLMIVQTRISRTSELDGCTISPIDSLISSAPSEGTIIVVGVLVKIKNDQYHIEDLTGCIPIEITDQTTFHAGIFHIGSVMIFEGEWDGRVLITCAIALLPSHSADETRAYIGNSNLFGGTERIAFRSCPKLANRAARGADSSIVILSDVNVDNHDTRRALFLLLEGFTSCPPTAFILCGDFCSRPLQLDSNQLVEDGFIQLAKLIKQFPVYSNSQFIFVPGMKDGGLTNILPRPPLPQYLQKPFSSLSNCIFTTNPARVQLLNQEIVIYRNDTVERLCNNAIHVPDNLDNLPNDVVRSITSNAHLSPLPPSIQPIIWSLDSTLRLHPLPDLLIMADRFENYHVEQKGCIVSNPGPFGRLQYHFHVYFPDKRKIDPSSIDLSN